MGTLSDAMHGDSMDASKNTFERNITNLGSYKVSNSSIIAIGALSHSLSETLSTFKRIGIINDNNDWKAENVILIQLVYKLSIVLLFLVIRLS